METAESLHGAIRQTVARMYEVGGFVKVDPFDLALLLADRDASDEQCKLLKLRLDAALVQLEQYKRRVIKEKTEWKK